MAMLRFWSCACERKLDPLCDSAKASSVLVQDHNLTMLANTRYMLLSLSHMSTNGAERSPGGLPL